MSFLRRRSYAVVLILLIVGAAIALGAARQTAAKPTARNAQQFVEQSENKMLDLWVASDRASWVQSTYITDDTEQIAADAQKAVLVNTTDLAMEAARYNGLDLPYDTKRKLELLKL